MGDTLSTQLVFSDEARKQLIAGAEKATRAIGCTLGPKGRTVLIQQEDKAPVLTKDGVTVSKSIRLRDPMERMGAELVREAAIRTNEVAGDGTTTATIITHNLMQGGMKLLASGHDAVQLCRGIEESSARILKSLQEYAVPVRTREEIEQVGTISANGDQAIGRLIADAMEAVGRDGIVTVEEAKGMKTTLEVVEGMQFERGYMSPYFVTDNERMHALYHECKVLVTDKKLSVLQDVVPVLEAVHRDGTPLLIIADEVEGEVLQALVVNRLQSNLKVVAIGAPAFGKTRQALLEDITKLVGATLVSSSTGHSLKDAAECLGTCSKVIVTAKATTLVGTGMTKETVEAHVSDLRSQCEDVTLNVEEVAILKTRIARLSGGVAIIKVGGATELEMIERKYRLEDALNATRAAVAEGIVPGGGITLAHLARGNTYQEEVAARMCQNPAEDLVRSACMSPFARIVVNTGGNAELVYGNVVRAIEALGPDPNSLGGDTRGRQVGYDAASGKVCDMLDAGIIDPVKVTRCALEHAVSVAVSFLSLDAVVVNEEEQETST